MVVVVVVEVVVVQEKRLGGVTERREDEGGGVARPASAWRKHVTTRQDHGFFRTGPTLHGNKHSHGFTY